MALVSTTWRAMCLNGARMTELTTQNPHTVTQEHQRMGERELLVLETFSVQSFTAV